MPLPISPVSSSKSFRLGVDVGGTFTDLILIEASSSQIVAKTKTPSTPHDQSIGVTNGIKRICEMANIEMNDIEHILHGTTVAYCYAGSGWALSLTNLARKIGHSYFIFAF